MNQVIGTYRERRAGRFITREQVNKKIEACQTCPRAEGHTCTAFGCSRYKFIEKILDPNSKCPEGHWDEI